MTPKVRYGLLVGGIGLFVNLVISAAVGLCGPFVTLLAGALAGWLTARALALPVRSQLASQGAQAGAITGALMIIGQLLGGVVALLILQGLNVTPAFGRMPANQIEQVSFWAAGLGAVLCFGVLGLALGAGAGAGAAYLTWRAPQGEAADTGAIFPPPPSF